MKKSLFIIILLLNAVFSIGQTVNDQAAVLQKIMDLPDLQQYYPKNSDGSVKQLCFMQYPTIFASAVIADLDVSKVEFRTMEAVNANHIPAYFAFRRMAVDDVTATATFNYIYDYNYADAKAKTLTINIVLKKSGTDWSVISLNIGGDKL